MSTLWRFSVLLVNLAYYAAIVTAQRDGAVDTHFQSQSQSMHQITIDDILPSKDKEGNVKCCVTGSYYDGKNCIFVTSEICPPNTTLVDSVCVSQPLCKDGLKFDSGSCVSTSTPTCPEGSKFNGQACSAETGPICEGGTVFDGKHCVSSELAECPPGYKLQDNSCVTSAKPICPPGTSLSETRCVDSQQPTCSPGSMYKNGACVSSQQPECPPGYRIIGGTCISSESPVSFQGLNIHYFLKIPISDILGIKFQNTFQIINC
jgi:hypothetical protein